MIFKVQSRLACCYLLLVSFVAAPLHAATRATTPTVWNALRKQFMLDHEVHRPEVQAQLRWLLKHPDYLKRFTEAEPYLFHIITEVKKQNLPGEIALVPIIESAFDPFAYSGVGAAGLWQIMPGTATDLGLKRDWWIDSRRSVSASTAAALKYYRYLGKFFHGNWQLAFAAYDFGEGNVARAVRRAGKSKEHAKFWTLPLPQETRTYIPRLLALAEIIEHPERYHIQLPHIKNKPYFQEVEVGQQIDLSQAAKLAGISYQELIHLNPGYNRWATAPYQPYKLLLPINHVKEFSKQLEELPKDQHISWSRHQVKSGETLSAIAQKYQSTSTMIKTSNHLTSDRVRPGQYVLVPNHMTTAPIQTTTNKAPTHMPSHQTYKVIHIVQKNDSFKTLNRKYGAPEQAVRAWNHLGEDHPIQPGQELLIWRQRMPSDYVVKPGDNLSRIASQHNLPLKKLLSLNPHAAQHLLKPGQTLQLRA